MTTATTSAPTFTHAHEVAFHVAQNEDVHPYRRIAAGVAHEVLMLEAVAADLGIGRETLNERRRETVERGGNLLATVANLNVRDAQRDVLAEVRFAEETLTRQTREAARAERRAALHAAGREECVRCGGTGTFHTYGTCFRCGGDGIDPR